MQNLISVQEFIETQFSPGSAPCTETVRRWIVTKQIPGRVFNSGRARYFVDLDAFKKQKTQAQDQQ